MEFSGKFILEAENLLFEFFAVQQMCRLQYYLFVACVCQLLQHCFRIVDFNTAFSQTFADNYGGKGTVLVIGREGCGECLLNAADIVGSGFVEGGAEADNHQSFFAIHL